MKVVLALIAIIALSIGAFLFWPRTDEPQINMSTDQSKPTNEQTSADTLVIGDKNAPVTIVEYGDFKCPNCAKFHTSTGQGIRQDYIETDQANIEFRNIALIGPDSQRAAQGAYCANDQSKFTQYHDAVYEYMWNTYYQAGNYQSEFDDVLTQEFLTKLAGEQGMNKQQFEACLSSGKYSDALQADLEQAEEDGARGTPYFVIGDQSITGPQPYSVFKTLIDLQLQ